MPLELLWKIGEFLSTARLRLNSTGVMFSKGCGFYASLELWIQLIYSGVVSAADKLTFID